MHASLLLRELRARVPGLVAFGMGGPKLRQAGLDVRVDCTELSAMGTSEVLTKIPKIWRAQRTLLRAALAERPDAIIFLDFPDFHFRLVRRLRGLKAHRIYYIPPKVWVWRKGRLDFLRRHFDRVLTILPFESKTYQEWGEQAKYVGNPLIDELPLSLSREDARSRIGLAQDRTCVALLPGSRRGEIERHLQLSMDSLRLLATELRRVGRLKPNERLCVRVPLPEGMRLDTLGLKDQLEAEIEFLFSSGDSAIVLRAADLALVKSGTSTLEAALLGCPHVVFYRPSRLTEWIFEKFVRYKGPVGLSNLITWRGEPGPYPFREMLCGEARADLIARELVSLFEIKERRAQIQSTIQEIRKSLLVDGSPSACAAEAVLELMRSAPGDVRSRNPWALVSLLWSSLNAARRWIHENTGVPKRRYPCRVIGVGNLEVGGTGKTPLVGWLGREAIGRGLSVWILTRGYRSEVESRGDLISPGSEPADPARYGDEAALLHALVPEAWIGVGASRHASYRRLLEKVSQPPDWLLLDDGFQQTRIEKDLDILTLTSRTPNQAPFREFFSQARRASLRVWTKGDVAPRVGYDARLQYQIELPLGWKKGDSILVLSGLADPAGFRSALTSLGLVIQSERALEDHARFSGELLQSVAQEARLNHWKLAVTGKDAVKLRDRPELLGVEVGVFEPKILWSEGREKVMRLLWNS